MNFIETDQQEQLLKERGNVSVLRHYHKLDLYIINFHYFQESV